MRANVVVSGQPVAMSTREQRNLWRQRATWLTQLGLGPDDPAPTAVVEEVSHAVVALLGELQRVEDERDTTIQSSTASHAPSDTVASMPDYNDHDHRAEAAFLDYTAAPTPDNAHTAELAIATLQRRHDALLRRLDGDAQPPLTPPHGHNAWDEPEACLEGSLTDLAEGALEDRPASLAHGLEALRALVHDVDEARRYARLLYQQVTFGVIDYRALEVPMDDDEWPAWLTYFDGDDPARQAPAP
jgi:hypothetical protein